MIRHKTQTQEAKWGDHGIKLVLHCGVLSVRAQKIQADTDKVILCTFLFLQRQCCVSWPPQLHFPSGSVWASCVRTHRSEDVHNCSSVSTQTSVTVGHGVTHCAWCPQVVPLRVKTASVFCGRIVRKDDTAFQNMAAEMAVYYGDKKPVAKELLEGHLYAVQVDKEIHRWGGASASKCLIQNYDYFLFVRDYQKHLRLLVDSCISIDGKRFFDSPLIDVDRTVYPAAGWRSCLSRREASGSTSASLFASLMWDMRRRSNHTRSCCFRSSSTLCLARRWRSSSAGSNRPTTSLNGTLRSFSAWTHTNRGVKTLTGTRSDCNSSSRRRRQIIQLVGAAV